MSSSYGLNFWDFRSRLVIIFYFLETMLYVGEKRILSLVIWWWKRNASLHIWYLSRTLVYSFCCCCVLRLIMCRGGLKLAVFHPVNCRWCGVVTLGSLDTSGIALGLHHKNEKWRCSCPEQLAWLLVKVKPVWCFDKKNVTSVSCCRKVKSCALKADSDYFLNESVFC